MEDLLLALGFAKTAGQASPVRFSHPESEALVLLPDYAREDEMREWHYLTVRSTLDDFGFLGRSDFDAAIHSRGRVAS